MSRKRKQAAPDEPIGAPEWMVTFSDCMTLLLTFFVLLLSFSSFDDKKFRRMETALAKAMPGVGVALSRDKQAVTITERVKYGEQLEKGTEKPTLEGKSQTNTKESLAFLTFENRKVFLTPSDTIFWGKGTLISRQGRQLMADMAALLNTVSNRIIISEYGMGDGPNTEIGLQRAWVVAKYLTTHGFDKARLSISAATTIPQQNTPGGTRYNANAKEQRTLEIVILDRSIYN